MGKFTFLHISDIHISDFDEKYSGNNILSNFSKYPNYERVFINKIKEYTSTDDLELKSIIISGDLANNGKTEDYQKINQFLQKLKTEFKLNSTDILIVPGNHDINWYTNEKAWEEDSKRKNAWEYQKDKFSDFERFFNNFYNDKDFTFDPNNAVSIIKTYNDIKLCFIGLNSCYKESFLGKDHYGYIDNNTLEEQLKKIKEKYANYGLIVFFHHNPFFIGEESKTLTNWSIIRDILIRNNIHNILFGHKHKVSSVNVVDSESITYFSIGSLGKIIDQSIGNNSFNLFVEEEISDSKLHFKRRTFKFMPSEEDRYLNTGYWEKQDGLKDYEDLIITLKKGFALSEDSPKPSETTPLSTDYTSDTSFEEEKEKEKESIIKSNEDEIIKIIAKEKLIKSGHFHWSGNRKTRTWIDTNKLFSSKYVLGIIRNDFIVKLKNIKEEKNIENIDLIMGLGIEGNIIASPLGIVFNSYYSYYPVPTRNDHNEFEKKLITGSFHNIVLVTDVVFEGSTILDFIKKYQNFFNSVKNLIILSVFYTGHDSIHRIFKENLNIEPVFRYLTNKIKIEKCNIDENKCSIYKLKLETIYEF